MKNQTSKSKISAIALVLMLTITATLVTVLPIKAQIIEYRPMFIYVAPQPAAGVGQDLFLVYFTDHMPLPADDDASRGAVGGRECWTGITLTITKPDGNEETIEMGPSDPVGGGFMFYTPDQIGTYSVQAHFPGEWKNRTSYIPYGDSPYRVTPPGDYYYEAADSIIATFTVQTEPIIRWPDVPLPTDYWMRPIAGPANTWSGLAANWLGSYAQVWPHGGAGGVTSNYGYGSAPESAHILWTRQYFPTGSIVDERFGTQVNYYGGYQSVGYSADPILDGRIHINPQNTQHYGGGGWEIWDLYTGEQLFYDPDATKPSFGQVYHYDSGNQGGCAVYLWKTSGITLPEMVGIANAKYAGAGILPERVSDELGNDYTLYNTTETPIVTGTLRELLDAYTGNTICYIANVSAPRGSVNVYGKDGSILYYNARNLGTTAAPNCYLQVWNSSAGTMVASPIGSGAWMWRPSGGPSGPGYFYLGGTASNYVHDGNLMWSLNVSMPSILGPRNALLNQTASILAVREGEYIIFGTTGRNDERGVVPGWMMGVSLVQGQEGQKLWESTFTPPFSSTEWFQTPFASPVSLVGVRPEHDVIVFSVKQELLTAIVYDLKSGQKLWQTDASIEPQMTYYGIQNMFYEDMIITGGVHSGVLTACDIRTGEIRWTYIGGAEGTESPYGNDMVRGFTVADGKLYTSVSEHSPTSPLWRTPGLKCLNITTGEEIWKILFWGSGHKIADGILTAWNLYDGQVYAFGKGPSATTVTASPKTSVHGTSVLIEGTVTDQTPTGRRNVNNVLQFSLEGTPAISDEDMRKWMEYMFMGQAKPTDAKGVEVVLTTLDPNGNTYELGTTTTDTNGEFGCVVDPPVPGLYTIIATFEGSDSYYRSDASTYINVEEAPSPAQSIEPEPTQPEPTELEPTTPQPTEPDTTELEPTTPQPTEPEPTEATEAPFITTEIAIIAAVAIACAIGVVLSLIHI